MKPVHSTTIYYASAGSGKTYSLARAYLIKILCAPRLDAYRHVLALTFTNKAVDEMKSRIIEYLAAFARRDPDPKIRALLEQMHNESGWPTAKLEEKAAQVLRHLMHHYAYFEVVTLDTFTHKVIRTFAHDLHLSQSFDVTLDQELLMEETVEQLMSQAGSDPDLTRLLLDFMMDKADDDKSWDIGRELQNIGHLLFSENHRSAIQQLPDRDLHSQWVLRNQLKNLRAKAIKDLQEGASALLAEIQRQGVPLEAFSRKTLPNFLRKLAEGTPDLSRRYESEDEIKLNKGYEQHQGIKPILVAGFQRLTAVQQRVLLLGQVLSHYAPVALLRRLKQDMDQIQKSRDLLSISEFNQLIADHIHNQPVPFIYERLGNRFHHFFIDEFQDTSVLQWKNLIPLVDHAIASVNDWGEKGTLSLFGDPKQSIYRWRGGRAEQLMALSQGELPFKNPDWELALLDTNYRSSQHVVAFNNAFFKFAADRLTHPVYRYLYEHQSSQKVHSQQPGYVEISLLPDAADDADCIAHTLDRIKQVREQGYDWGDIALLVRRNQEGAMLAQALLEAEIPVITPDSLLLEQSDEVQFLIQALQWIDQPANLQAKARMLYYIGQNTLRVSPLHDFIREGLDQQREADWDAWLKSKGIALVWHQLRQLSLLDICLRLSDCCIPTERQSAFVVHFHDLVLECQNKRKHRLREFLWFWDKRKDKLSIAPPQVGNAVRIMTIHASKGLEFPVVIYSFANTHFDRSPAEFMWLPLHQSDIDVSLYLAKKTSALAEANPEAADILLQREQEDWLDRINVLYVAQTRAAEQLYIISQDVKPTQSGTLPNKQGTLYRSFLESEGLWREGQTVYAVYGTPERHQPATAATPSGIALQRSGSRLGSHQLRLAQPAWLPDPTVANTTQPRRFGQLVHELLSEIRTSADIEPVLQRAQERGKVKHGQYNQLQAWFEALTQHPALTPFFSELALHRCEAPIITAQGAVFVPDRVSLFPQREAYLLDYKTGRFDPAHQAQVQQYADLLSDMGYTVVKKALIYLSDLPEVVLL